MTKRKEPALNIRIYLKKAAAALTALVIAFTALTCFKPVSLTVGADEQEELEQKLKENKAKQEELEKKIKDTKNDIAKEEENQEAIDEKIETTEEYIQTLAELIGEYTEQIDALDGEISALEGDIEIQELLIENKRAEIDENIYLYEQHVRAIYLSGNDSVASIILGATDFFDLLMKIELVKRVANYNNDLIDSLLQMKSEYEAAELELENQVAALEETKEITEGKRKEQENLQAEWQSDLKELQDLLSQSKKAISSLEKKKDSYNSDKAALDKEAEKLESDIKAIIRQKARAEYIGDLPEGTFLWPCPGHYTITSGYGSRWGTTHRGIDISDKNIHGADICAANSGEVIFVNNSCTHNYGKDKSCGCGSGFGNYCIVDHGGGYQTVYGHAEKIIVKEGQHVTTGQTLGYVGSTGDSTGWHLHFETRIDGSRVDPQGSQVNLIEK